VLGATCFGTHGKPREVEAAQEVRVHELGRKVEPQHVEGTGVTVGVDREQRHSVRPELRLEVSPRCIGALGRCVVALVEDLVEDLEPLVGQPDLVGIRVHEQPGQPV
jgi:hypothetical protein